MKNMEVTHTLRLYDTEFISKLGMLMKREQKHFRTKNEFMTRILMLGYDAYMSALNRNEERAGTIVGVGIVSDNRQKARRKKVSVEISDIKGDKGMDDIYQLLSELTEYLVVQFKTIDVRNFAYQKMLSAVYHILLDFVGEDIVAQKADEGFFDDLPIRFTKLLNLK